MSYQVEISIIYVNWNCAEAILHSIASLRELTLEDSYEVLVVDNDSPEGPGVLLEDKEIRLILSDVNRGFGAGCNLGAAAAEGKYLLFLNPDTQLLNDVPGELKRFLEAHPLGGIAGAVVEDSLGFVLYDGGRALPSLWNEFLQHSTLCFRYPGKRWASEPYLSHWDHRSSRLVGSVSGACMMMRVDDFERAQGFDEGFFLYCEEVDLCYRISKLDLEVWYVHTARILHRERQSTLQLYGSLSRIVLQNLKSQNYYFKKHDGVLFAFLWRCMIVVLYTARYLVGRDQACLEYVRWAVSA